MKGTFHKSCSCPMCVRGRSTKSGKSVKKANERKLRHNAKVKLGRVVKGDTDDAVVAPISSPYTD